MSQIVKKLLDEALSANDRPSLPAPDANFFLRFSELFERGRAEVLKGAVWAGAPMQAGTVLLPAVLVTRDSSVVESIEVTLSQVWPEKEKLDLGLKWDRNKCDPSSARVIASLIDCETGNVIDSVPIVALPDEQDYLVTFSLPPEVGGKWKDLTLSVMGQHPPCSLILNLGARSPQK